MNQQNQPVYIMSQETQRTQGKNAQRINILAAREVANTVKTTLGPKGMDKMIVSGVGEVTVTNDGVTILKEMEVQHPVAKVMVEIAKSQEDLVGDGTTTAVVLAGELLKNAEPLLDQGIHPTVIARGYKIAEEYSQKVLNQLAEPVTKESKKVLENIAKTAMTGKIAGSNKDLLAKLVVESVIKTKNLGREKIKIQKRVGESIDKSELIYGLVLERELAHHGMQKTIQNPRVLVIDQELGLQTTNAETNIQFSDPQKYQEFLLQEQNSMKQLVLTLKDLGVNFIACSKSINPAIEYILAQNGINAVRRLKREDLEKVALLSTAQIVSNIKEVKQEQLGLLNYITEKEINNKKYTFLVGSDRPEVLTLFVSGSTEHVADEVVRAVSDAIGDLVATLQDGKALGGAGAIEIRLARELRKYSLKLDGKEQLGVEAFANSIEAIPKALAENSGLDPTDVLTMLRKKSQRIKWSGINVFTGKVMDSWEEGVVEPLRVKTQALFGATEVAEMILRIDDVIQGFMPDPKTLGVRDDQ